MREKSERDQKSARVDIVATHATAATVPKPGVSSSRPAFEEKRGEERAGEGKKERDRKRETRNSERERQKERDRKKQRDI